MQRVVNTSRFPWWISEWFVDTSRFPRWSSEWIRLSWWHFSIFSDEFINGFEQKDQSPWRVSDASGKVTCTKSNSSKSKSRATDYYSTRWCSTGVTRGIPNGGACWIQTDSNPKCTAPKWARQSWFCLILKKLEMILLAQFDAQWKKIVKSYIHIEWKMDGAAPAEVKFHFPFC